MPSGSNRISLTCPWGTTRCSRPRGNDAELAGAQGHARVPLHHVERPVDDPEQLVLAVVGVPGHLVPLQPHDLDVLPVQLADDLGRVRVAESREAVLDIDDLHHGAPLPSPRSTTPRPVVRVRAGRGSALALRVPIVAGHGEAEQGILDLRTVSDVVDDQRPVPVRRRAVGHQADVRQISGQHPRDDVARQVVAGVVGDGQLRALTPEEGPQVGHPPVVDAGVRPFQTPVGGIGVEIADHVLVDPLLEVDTHGSIAAHDQVGADPDVAGHVAPGVGDPAVRAVVRDPVGGPLDGRVDQPQRERRAIRGLRRGRRGAAGRDGGQRDDPGPAPADHRGGAPPPPGSRRVIRPATARCGWYLPGISTVRSSSTRNSGSNSSRSSRSDEK